jgi:hypothetical protein
MGERPRTRDARVGPCRACIAEHSGEKQAHTKAGSLLVEAEPVGDRGSFPAAGDPQLGEDP